MSHANIKSFWYERYGHICATERGVIVPIKGVGHKDTYNPTICPRSRGHVLAFRCEDRASDAHNPDTYHPAIYFARQHEATGEYEVCPDIAPFDMREDPFCVPTLEDGQERLIFGGVVVSRRGRIVIPSTELYHGDSLEVLDRKPFATVHGMKDVRLLQLPDERYLLCRRPQGARYGRGRITVHVLDSLEELISKAKIDISVKGVLNSCINSLDWVGVNQLMMLHDANNVPWVGLLGHVASGDEQGNVHYAICTYKIKLDDLLNDRYIAEACPKVIACRACFESGPAKAPYLEDVTFPGSLEHIEAWDYHLWAGLSDTRIGRIPIHDPFGFLE